MTPDTCPYCGARRTITGILQTYYACGTAGCTKDGKPSFGQSDQCARYVRTRISQLQRMARCACRRMDELLDLDADDNGFSQGFYWRWFGRFTAFRDACLRKIDRLRGAQ